MPQVILTVGSTEFTSLVNSFLSHSSLEALASLKTKTILAQVGNSTLPTGWTLGSTLTNEGIKIEVVKFLSDLESKVAEAEIVISHAGAGCILSFLRPAKGTVVPPKRSLILVPNTTLMDSHQSDLADEMSNEGWARVCSPEELSETLLSLEFTKNALRLAPTYPDFDPKKISSILDSTDLLPSNHLAKPYALDSVNAERLWKLSEEMVGQKFDV